MNWLESSQARPSPFWNLKQTYFSQVPHYCRSKVLCFGSVVSDVRWKIYSTTQQIPLFWSVTSFLKQWIPVIKWIENVRQSRNNFDYGNQKLVLNISKFPPDTDMLFKINKNKKCFILMGAFACSWHIIK